MKFPTQHKPAFDSDAMLDMRFVLKSDGLWRTCIVCGREFRITSTAETFRENKAGRICEIVFGVLHPRNLLQLQCGHCPPAGGAESTTLSGAGPTDPRWGLRRDGLESWRDYNG